MVPDNQNEGGLPPVSLPAGSYDATVLATALDKAVSESDPAKRDDAIADALDQANETAFDDAEIMPGYKPVEVKTVIGDETIVESVLVYHPDDAADAEPVPAAPSIAPAAPAAAFTPPAPAVQPTDPDASASGDHEE